MHIRKDRATGHRRCDVPTCIEHIGLQPVGKLALCRFHCITTGMGRNMRTCEVAQCDNFASQYGELYLCPFHIGDRQRKVETVTPSGIPMCHARGCLKKNIRSCRLTWAHDGLWCPQHLPMINDVRYLLDREKQGRAGNRAYELYWREQEAQFRKQPDPKHLWYMEKLRESIRLSG